jgi:hypothetical protein
VKRAKARVKHGLATSFVASCLRVVVLLAMLLGFSSAFSSTASASDEPIASTPHDVPLVLRVSSIPIPPLPAAYEQRDLGWITIAYPPSVHARVQPLIDDSAAIKAKLADALGQSVLDHVEVRVARTAEDMAELAPRDSPPPTYASGVAYPSLHLVLLSLTAPVGAEATDLGEVFRHELAHIALEDSVRGHHVPQWFNEGFALNESGEKWFVRLQTLWNATLSRSVIPLSDLDRSFPAQDYEVSIAYAESGDVVRFLLRDGDRLRFWTLVERVQGGQPFDAALADAYGTDLHKLEYQWREDIAKRYTFWPVLASSSLLWVAACGILVLAYVRKKRRNRATIARWEHEDALHAAPARELIEEVSPMPEAMRAASGLPKVEHEGGWHTVH